jgi:hypothetical protein
VYAIVSEDNPLHIETANCPYISGSVATRSRLWANSLGPTAKMTSFTDWNTTFRPVRELQTAPKTLLEVRASSAAYKGSISGQLFEQRFGFLQIARVESLCEPAVDRSEKLASLLPLTLLAPEPRHTHCGA